MADIVTDNAEAWRNSPTSLPAIVYDDVGTWGEYVQAVLSDWERAGILGRSEAIRSNLPDDMECSQVIVQFRIAPEVTIVDGEGHAFNINDSRLSQTPGRR